MFKKHQNIRYLFAKSQELLYQKLHPEAPWLTPQAIDLLNELIRKDDIGVEFGSGRSTHWLAARCKGLISIENNESWYQYVKEKTQHLKHVQYLFKTIDRAQPEQSAYLDMIPSIADDSVDFVLDDGKIRDWVALKMLPKLKAGGLFILDNAERYLPNSFHLPESVDDAQITSNWKDFLNQTHGWRRIWTTNGVTSTLILFKP